jgi:hypothetical protein
MKFCAACGEGWTSGSRRADARYCSDTCRQRGHRAKRASDETAHSRPSGSPWRASAAAGPQHTAAAAEAAPRPAQARDAAGRLIDVRALIG